MNNFGEKVSFIWSVADLLRGPYRPNQYKDVMLPMTVLRRLDCVLEPTKDKVLERKKKLAGGKVRLLGYDLDEGLTEFEGDHYLTNTFYWQNLARMDENYRLYLKLVNGVYHIWGEQESYPIWDGFMTAEWEPGTIIRDVHGIVVEPGTPPGSYQVTVDWLQPYTQQTLPPDGEPFVAGPVTIAARSIAWKPLKGN